MVSKVSARNRRKKNTVPPKNTLRAIDFEKAPLMDVSSVVVD